MSKMTIAEAAEHYNVSKEAIHNRIRRGSLDSVIEHGTKYVVIAESRPSAPQDNRYYEYIEQENAALKQRVSALESETAHLREQRETMLIAERNKIEQIYKERDEQLRNVLNMVASKYLTQANMDSVIEEVTTAEVIDASESLQSEAVRLKTFLKLKDYRPKKKERIKARFEQAFEQGDVRIIEKKGKLFIDPQQYDYSDLLD